MQVIATSRLFRVSPTEVVSWSFAAKSWLRWNLATECGFRHKYACIWQLTYYAWSSCTGLLKQHTFCVCSYACTTEHKRVRETFVQLGARKQGSFEACPQRDYKPISGLLTHYRAAHLAELWHKRHFYSPHFRPSTIGEQECIFQIRCEPLLALIWICCRYILHV
jgi:hypothetical protein